MARRSARLLMLCLLAAASLLACGRATRPGQDGGPTPRVDGPPWPPPPEIGPWPPPPDRGPWPGPELGPWWPDVGRPDWYYPSPDWYYPKPDWYKPKPDWYKPKLDQPGPVGEKVTCSFGAMSPKVESCYSSKGPGCSGLGGCSVAVSGYYGEPVDWKSTCGGYATTIIDGQDEVVAFNCQPPVPVKETVTCYFKGSTTYQTCYSPKGTCQGLLGCTIEVTGMMGESVQWKSSCGGYATTVMDGNDEPADFYCGGGLDGGPWPPPPWPWPDAGLPWP